MRTRQIFAVGSLDSAFDRSGLGLCRRMAKKARLTGRINVSFRASDINFAYLRSFVDTFHRPGYYRDPEFAYLATHQKRRILYAIWHIKAMKLGSCKMKEPVNSPRRLPDSAMRRIVLTITGLLLLTSLASRAESLAWTRAHELYQRTDYAGSLRELLGASERDAAVHLLMGQDYFGLAEYKQATDSLEKAVALAPANAEYFLWLGRAYGRRAETSNPFSAPGFASKSRQMFERAVALDPANREAVGDLFDYYLGAPGFLGGGENKAESLAAKVAQHDPAEGHYYQAQLDDHRGNMIRRSGTCVRR